MELASFEVKEKKIGDNIFYVRPFPVLQALELLGDLQAVFTTGLEKFDVKDDAQKDGAPKSFLEKNVTLGAAIAGIAENKIMPYYEKLGIDGSQIVFDADGKFTLTIKKLPVKGTISKQDDGTFKMEFLSGIGSIAENLRTMNAYLQKTSNTLSLTVDAKKLLDIVEKVASKADSSIIGTATKLLDSYDQVCIGLKLQKQ